jgi:hypothetical protein
MSCVRRAEIRQHLLLHLTLAQRGQVIVNGFIFIHANLAGVGADEPFIEYPSRQLIELFLLQRAQHAGADLRGAGDCVQ